MIEEAFAYYTECQLATVEGLESRKSPPKGELARHRQIADEMVAVCRKHQIKPDGRPGRSTPRLMRLLGQS